MTIPEAVKLVLKAAEVAQGGEIFILKMPVLRIIDLAEVMIEELSEGFGYKPGQIKIKFVGAGAGEKMNEELLTEQECVSVEENKDMYIVQPHLLTTESAKKPRVKRPVSTNARMLTKEEVRDLFKGFV